MSMNAQHQTDQEQLEKPPPSVARLPRLMLVLGVVAILLLGTSYVWLKNSPEGDQPAIGGPFTLIDASGKPVTDRDFRGKYLLVYFGYTFCPDVCPTTLNEITAALDSLGAKAARVQPLFMTVDPQRDTPPVLHQYTAAFGPRLIALTGTPEQIAAVEKEYRVYVAVHRTGNGPNDDSMDHSSIIYLMGPDGRFVAPIHADEGGEAMAADIARHLR
jgi:protein SCO1